MTSRTVAIKVHPSLWEAFQILRQTTLSGFATDSAALKGLMVSSLVGEQNSEIAAAVASCPLPVQDEIYDTLLQDLTANQDPRPRLAALLAKRRWVGFPRDLEHFVSGPQAGGRTAP